MKVLYKILWAITLAVSPFFMFAQVSNGSFENWTGGSPDDWTTIDSGISVAENTYVTKDGSSSAAITVNTGTQASTDFRQTVSVTSGQSYTFSVWVYHTEGNLKARLYVDGYQGYSSTTTGSWQQLSYTITPSSSSIEVGLRFYDQSGFDGSEVVYVDLFEPTTSSGGGGGSGGGSGSSCADTEGVFTLTTDNYGSETSWVITSGGSTVYSGSGYSNNTTYTEDLCLADGDYVFTISDSYGDGICCSYGSGSYDLTIDGTSIASGGNFGSSASASFTVGGGSSGGGSGSGGGASGSGYYASADGLSGYTLKSALHDIIDGHSSQGYGALWTFYSANEIDTYYENDGSIIDIYSEKPSGSDSYNFTPSSDQCGTYSSEGDCYNREHSFPRSWFGGSVEPMNSDVHHIFPTDGYVNGRRSSYPYGEVGSATYTSSNGSKLGSASGIGYSGTVFEPIDEFKGDIARAYFYMATRYEDVISGWGSNSSYGNAVLDGSSDQVFESWVIAMLLDWHINDPVSTKETDRNDAAYSHQGNRNPFVDHPEYVDLIWSSSSSRKADQQINAKSELTYEAVIFENGLMQLNISDERIQNVQVLDIAGREIFSAKINGASELQVPAQKYQAYILKLSSYKETVVSKIVMR